MPRRIPDFPDMYWSWNYLSSVGSLISVIGVLVFFWLLWDIYSINSLFFQMKNNYYVIILNTIFIKKTNLFSFSKNLYIFPKYNFFFYFREYLFLDKYYLIIFSQLCILFFNYSCKEILTFSNFNFKSFTNIKDLFNISSFIF